MTTILILKLNVRNPRNLRLYQNPMKDQLRKEKKAKNLPNREVNKVKQLVLVNLKTIRNKNEFDYQEWV